MQSMGFIISIIGIIMEGGFTIFGGCPLGIKSQALKIEDGYAKYYKGIIQI